MNEAKFLCEVPPAMMSLGHHFWIHTGTVLSAEQGQYSILLCEIYQE
jgi:hypothetical protein